MKNSTSNTTLLITTLTLTLVSLVVFNILHSSRDSKREDSFGTRQEITSASKVLLTKKEWLESASKNIVKDEFISSTYWIKRMPFWKRLKYAWKIIKGA